MPHSHRNLPAILCLAVFLPPCAWPQPAPGPEAPPIRVMHKGKSPSAHLPAWEEERVMEFVMAYSPLIRAQQEVTNRFVPASNKRRLLEHTELFTGFSVGGTEFRSEPLTVLAGARISIPLSSPKERREFAERRMQEAQKIDEVRESLAGDMMLLRQYEAELEALRIRFKYLKDRSAWAQERVGQGYDTTETLWDIAQKLTTERSGEVKLTSQIRSQRLQIAHYAGSEWPALHAYLEGKAGLDEPRVATRFELPEVE